MRFDFLHVTRSVDIPHPPIEAKILTKRLECQQTSPRPYACYASAPNDVWSLGVILVNLTCGRNPWKKASLDDSTFRAFRKDRNFLRSILPLTPELDSILARVFECDAQKRITLPELRELIVACPYFTTTYQSTVGEPLYAFETPECDGYVLPPTPPETPVPGLFPEHCQAWAGVGTRSKRNSCYSTSSGSDYDSDASSLPGDSPCTPHYNFYGSLIPLADAAEKVFGHQQTVSPTVLNDY